jgi:hypothetical protein
MRWWLRRRVNQMVKDEGSGKRPKRKVRDGWDEKFKAATPPDEPLLIPDELTNEFDEKEWTW